MRFCRVLLVVTLVNIMVACTKHDREVPPHVTERANWWVEQVEAQTKSSQTPHSLAETLRELGAIGKFESIETDKIFHVKLERVVSSESFCGYEDIGMFAYFDDGGQLDDYWIGLGSTCLAVEKK